MPTSINQYAGNCCKCGVHVPARKGIYDLGRLYCAALECMPPLPVYQRPRRKTVYIDNSRPPRGSRRG